jgi:CRP/FNR family transcriptional regulator
MLNRVSVSKKLDLFFKQGKQIYYKKAETIISRETDKPKYIYFLKKGYVHQYTITSTKSINMNIYKPNSYFPLSFIFNHVPNIYSYEAITDAVMYSVTRSKFLLFVKENPDVLFDLASRLSTGLNTMIKVIESLMSFDSSDKMIRILLTCAERFGVRQKDEIIIDVPLTHSDIANMVGISRETATREIGDLTKLKFIRKVNGRYRLRKPEKLEKRLKD